MEDASSIDVEVAQRRVTSREVAELVVGVRDTDVTPVLVLRGQVARSTTHVDVAALNHTVRQRVVELVATPVKRRLHSVTDEGLAPEPLNHLNISFNHHIVNQLKYNLVKMNIYMDFAHCSLPLPLLKPVSFNLR